MNDEQPAAGDPLAGPARPPTPSEGAPAAAPDPAPADAEPAPAPSVPAADPAPAVAVPASTAAPTDIAPADAPSVAAPSAPTTADAPAPADGAGDGDGDGEVAGDALPAELDVTAYVGPYTFPDIRRRRWPGYVYLAVATGCFALWATSGGDAVMVNDGMLVAAIGLLAIGAYHVAAAWPLAIGDGDALVAAASKVGFPVGHASAQLGWRGLRSRPTWRILLYSNEDPPRQRGLVLVDGVDGGVLDHFVEDNPEDWAEFDT